MVSVDASSYSTEFSYIYKWTHSLLANRDGKLQQLQMFKIALSAKYNRMKLQADQDKA
jgi:hypothetical protein